MTTTISISPGVDPSVVTNERANLLAAHAIHVQGGFSTPENERERAEKDIAHGAVFDWATIEAEVRAAVVKAVAVTAPAAPTVTTFTSTPPAVKVGASEQRADVSAVLAHVDKGEALRDRIKAMQDELKVHEDAIKGALGEATIGTDAKGNIVVRYPHRERHGLDKSKVQDILTPEQFGECSKVTPYRTLLYGEG